MNAMLLAGALGDAACPLIAGSQAEAMALGATGRIVLMGGVTPAQTTDAVAAVLAEWCGADLMVNLTSVDGIYTADPRIDPAAERLARLTPEKLLGDCRNRVTHGGGKHGDRYDRGKSDPAIRYPAARH